MIIKINQSLPNENGGITPNMLGKEFEVLKEDTNGVWVRDGKLETLVLFEELEIVKINKQKEQLLREFLIAQ